MPTPAERSALLFVAAVAALGLGVRGYRALSSTAPPPTDREALALQLAAVDSAIAQGGSRSTQRVRPGQGAGEFAGEARVRPRPPLRNRSASDAPSPHLGSRTVQDASGEPALVIDPDRASAAELDRLPGIGPALAARIVASRDSAGPFGSLDKLQRVRGIGPGLAARIAPHVAFSRGPARGPR